MRHGLSRRLLARHRRANRIVRSSYFTLARFVAEPWGIRRQINGERLRLAYPYAVRIHGDYEREAMRTFLSFCMPFQSIFDIGANFGLYAVLAARKGAVVHAFEPMPEMVEALRRHRDLNGVEDAITINGVVVDESSGVVDFWEPELERHRAQMAASLSQDWVQSHREHVRHCKRQAVSLNDYCDQTGVIPDLIKIDVEGAEARVLRGASNYLASRRGHILLEVHPRALECLGDSEAELWHLLSSYGWARTRELDRGGNTAHYLVSPGID